MICESLMASNQVKATDDNIDRLKKNLEWSVKTYGVPETYQMKSISIFRQETEQGSAGAQYYLAQRYENGYGVPKDFKEAVKWYELANEHECSELEKIKYWLISGDQGSGKNHPGKK